MSNLLCRALLYCSIPVAVYGCIVVAASFQTDAVYDKDFIQPYLMARAILTGANPYTPLPDLTQTYLGIPQQHLLPHPTPHSPFGGPIAAWHTHSVAGSKRNRLPTSGGSWGVFTQKCSLRMIKAVGEPELR